MGYCVVCLIMLFIIAVQGFSISSVRHDNGAIELKSSSGEVRNYTGVNEHYERQRRMTHMFKKPPPRDLTSLEQFCKFVKDWLATFKFGFSFTSRPFKNFNYVVRKKEKQKICFGSGKSRIISIKSGMDFFMRYNTHENFPNIGPGTYNDMESYNAIKSKVFSQKGYGGLTRTVCSPHTEDYPAPNEYNVPSSLDNLRETKYPFLSTVKRNLFHINTSPGPNVYQMTTPIDRRKMFEHNFGQRITMRLPVEIKCCKRNMDVCDICNQKPIGDYWHLNNRKFLCRPCMIVERHKQTKLKNDKLQNFRKIRDCSWIHWHEGTDAKIWLLQPRVIQKWGQNEAYMSSFIND